MKLNEALKNHTESYRVAIHDNLDPKVHFEEVKPYVKEHMIKVLSKMKSYKFLESLVVNFKKFLGNNLVFKPGAEYDYKKAYFNCRIKTTTNELHIDSVIASSHAEIMNLVEAWISEGSGWSIDFIDGNFINYTKYQPLKGSSYIEIPKVLTILKKG